MTHTNSDLVWTIRLNTYVLIITCAIVCGALALATVVTIGVVNKTSGHLNRVADALEGVDGKLNTLLDFVDHHVADEKKYRGQADQFIKQYSELSEKRKQTEK